MPLSNNSEKLGFSLSTGNLAILLYLFLLTFSTNYSTFRMNAGFPGDNNFQAMKAVMKTANPILEIFRNCGMLLRMNDERIQQKVRQYLMSVKKAGFQIASDGTVSEEVISGLNMELLPVQQYIDIISK